MATRDLAASPQFTLRRSGRRWGEDAVKGILALCALVSVATTVGIVIALFAPALEFFREVSIVDYLTGTNWAPLFVPSSFGVLPLVAGTLLVGVFAAFVCIPFGLGAAIYLSEYARLRTRSVLKPALEILAGIPTVVYGYFALTFISPGLQKLGLPVGVFSALAAAIVIGIMLIPTVASVSEDAMAAVPSDLRYGAYALGASRMHVATRIVVPAAISGIIASFVLAMSRAVGETMIVLIAAGGQPNLTWNPVAAVQTMTAFIAATGQGDTPTGSLEYKTIFAVGATLFVGTLIMNMVAIRLVRRYREVYE
ncbi:MAG: phosphate ABC transporter permease subunit PstC [Gaiellaceae bacterium]